MSSNKNIQLGLCCINTILRKNSPPIYCSRRMIIRTIEKYGIKKLQEKIIQNLTDLITMIEWNEQNGIKVFRLSSELFPHKSNQKVQDYSFDFAKELLIQAGLLAKKYNQRLTFHPGQYNVIGTNNEEYFIKTMLDLEYHADVLDLMGMDQNSVIVIHGGGVYNNKKKTIARWIENFNRLPEKVKTRLAIENCEKSFSIKDCLLISKNTNIPVVFDTHHYNCYNELHPDENILPAENYIRDILNTWLSRNIKPKFHVSEQGDGRVGHHSDYIETIPDYLLNIPEKYNIDIDIMIEAKMKEQAIFKLYEKYEFLNCKLNRNDEQ